MLRKKVRPFAIAAVLLVSGTVFAAAISPSGDGAVSKTEEQRYLIKAEDETLFVYDKEQKNRREVSDIILDALPPGEQHALRQGVWTADERSLKQLLEDYTN